MSSDPGDDSLTSDQSCGGNGTVVGYPYEPNAGWLNPAMFYSCVWQAGGDVDHFVSFQSDRVGQTSLGALGEGVPLGPPSGG